MKAGPPGEGSPTNRSYRWWTSKPWPSNEGASAGWAGRPDGRFDVVDAASLAVHRRRVRGAKATEPVGRFRLVGAETLAVQRQQTADRKVAFGGNLGCPMKVRPAAASSGRTGGRPSRILGRRQTKEERVRQAPRPATRRSLRIGGGGLKGRPRGNSDHAVGRSRGASHEMLLRSGRPTHRSPSSRRSSAVLREARVRTWREGVANHAGSARAKGKGRRKRDQPRAAAAWRRCKGAQVVARDP